MDNLRHTLFEGMSCLCQLICLKLGSQGAATKDCCWTDICNSEASDQGALPITYIGVYVVKTFAVSLL